jgi:hypothetical protein
MPFLNLKKSVPLPPSWLKTQATKCKQRKQGKKESMHTLNSTLPNCSHKKATKLGATSKGNRKFHNSLKGIKVLLSD